MEEVAVVDCEAATVEKRDMVNPDQATKLRPSFLTLTYKISNPNTKIIPFLPQKTIEKSNEEPVKFGRTESFDVFLNDECMSRNYAHIYAEKGDPSLFKVVNFSASKAVIVDNKQLWQNEICYITDKSVLQLDIVTFFVSIRCGDKNAGGYAVRIEPEIQSNQQLCGSSDFQIQEAGNFNLNLITACPQIQNSPNGTPVYQQVYNSPNWSALFPQVNNSPNWPALSSQIPNPLNCKPVYPHIQINTSSNGIPVCHNIHNSSIGTPMSPQIHNLPNRPALSPQIPNPLNCKPVNAQLNKIQSTYWSPSGKGSSQHQPQEHSMPSEVDFPTEKQRQYQFIEDLSRK